MCSVHLYKRSVGENTRCSQVFFPTSRVLYRFLKAWANEDTLLRTHCCRHKCFPVCPTWATFVADTNFVSGTQQMFLILFRNIFVHSKCFPVCAAQETSWATMCPQQCVLVCQVLKCFTTEQSTLEASLFVL